MPMNRFRIKLAPPPGKKFVADWNGMRVKTTKVLRNANVEKPVGATGEVNTHGGTGLTIKFDACACCGSRSIMTRLHSSDVEPI